MKLTCYTSPHEFLTAAHEALEAKEVVNSLMLGIVENWSGSCANFPNDLPIRTNNLRRVE